VVALHHIFEQQILYFHRKQVLHHSEQSDPKLIDMREFKRRLSDAGVEYEALPSWRTIIELRLVANAVKHAEGCSAVELRTLRPDLFEHPTLRKMSSLARIGIPEVFMPLSGEDIYLAADDLEAYQIGICKFWEEFADAIRRTL
jgi:hypothetical protein